MINNLSDSFNKLFSNVILESQNFNINLNYQNDLQHNDIDTPLSNQGHGPFCKQLDGKVLYDFGLKNDLSVFGLNHPIYLKSILKCLNYSSDQVIVTSSAIKELSLRFNQIFKHFGNWNCILGTQAKQISEQTKWFNISELTPSEKITFIESKTDVDFISGFHLIYDLPLLSDKICAFKTSSPFSSELIFYKSSLELNLTERNFHIEHFQLQALTLFSTYLKETQILKPGHLYSQLIDFTETISKQLKNNEGVIEVVQNGLELEIKLATPKDAMRLRKRLWLNNIYSIITANSLLLRTPLSLNKNEQMDILEKITKVNEGS